MRRAKKMVGGANPEKKTGLPSEPYAVNRGLSMPKKQKQQKAVLSDKGKAMRRGSASTVRQGQGPAGGKGTRSLGGTKSEGVNKTFTKKKLKYRKPKY